MLFVWPVKSVIVHVMGHSNATTTCGTSVVKLTQTGTTVFNKLCIDIFLVDVCLYKGVCCTQYWSNLAPFNIPHLFLPIGSVLLIQGVDFHIYTVSFSFPADRNAGAVIRFDKI